MSVDTSLAPFKKMPVKKEKPPRIPAVDAAVHYIAERFPGEKNQTVRERLCSDTETCTPWSVEPFFLKELTVAKQNDDAKQIEIIRKLLRAVSSQGHHQLSKPQMLSIARAWQMREKMETSNLSDQELGEDRLAQTDQIIDAIEHTSTNSMALPACEAIEQALTMTYRDYEQVKKQRSEHARDHLTKKLKERQELLVKQICNLRILRDQIYFQAMFSGWYLPKD